MDDTIEIRVGGKEHYIPRCLWSATFENESKLEYYTPEITPHKRLRCLGCRGVEDSCPEYIPIGGLQYEQERTAV